MRRPLGINIKDNQHISVHKSLVNYAYTKLHVIVPREQKMINPRKHERKFLKNPTLRNQQLKSLTN